MKNEILKKMGERISQKRKELKMTQETLAERIDASTQMISNLELGKKAIRPENLIKICSVLDLSADYILNGDTDKDEEKEKSKLDNQSYITDKLDGLSYEEIEMIKNFIKYISQKKSNN